MSDVVGSRYGSMELGIDLEALLACGTATVHEVAGSGTVLPPAIVPIVPGCKLCGPAFPIDCGPGDNLWIHRGLYLARPGTILVVSCGNEYEHGYWGEILSIAARERGLGGAVIDGFVRDAAALQDIGFPVFARGLCVRGTAKHPRADCGVASSIIIGQAVVRTGDIVMGDADGVICVPTERLDGLLANARKRVAKELGVIDGLRAGQRSLDLLGIDP